MNIINWLEKWYQSNCDTEWEHAYGIKINTLDNPGWIVEIDLADTPLKDKVFENIKIDNGNEDWIICCVNNDVYTGSGDTAKLEEILNMFKEWVES